MPSGRNEGPKKRYSVQFKSDYQIRFNDDETKESFIISIGENNRIQLFLNSIEVVVDYERLEYQN